VSVKRVKLHFLGIAACELSRQDLIKMWKEALRRTAYGPPGSWTLAVFPIAGSES